jgi:hypothetical protein
MVNRHFIKSCILLLFLITPFLFFGQLQFVRADTIPAFRDGEKLHLAWAGGFNSPQFSSIDLNDDGFKDLFVLERNFYGIVKTFLNKGLANSVSYTHEPFFQGAFPAMRNWALLADYNCDGHEDIFTSVPFGMAVYQNAKGITGKLEFEKVTSLLRTATPDGDEILFVSPPDIPSVTDIDNDGDLDILAFDILGKYVVYNKNLSVETNGDCSELLYEIKNRCWGYFSENETNNGINLNDTCDEQVPDPEKGGRHAGSTLLALDLTGNGVKDLVIGDIAHDNLVKLTNGGTTTASSMVMVDTAFPSNSIPVDLTTYPAAFYHDVNNDSKKDLLVSPNNPNTSANTHSSWYYENTGGEDVPEFTFRQDDFLQGQMIDVGEGAKPVFFDYDSDGLMDIVIGNFGYFIEAAVFESKLALFRNTGTISQPSYEFIDDDYAGLSSFAFKGVYPAFGDMDNDGDNDMIIGDEDGHIHLFTNVAGTGEPAVFVLSGPSYKGIDAGQTAMPQIVDVNKDELPDLLIGERSGTIKYYENTGSSTEADFSSTPANDLFGGIDVMLECCTGFSAPYMTHDSLGNSILYVGSERGVLYLYNNIDDNLEGAFDIVDSLFLHGLQVNVSGSDINNDGREELVYGEYAGGIAILTSGSPQFIDVQEAVISETGFQVFPNPARSIIQVRLATAAAHTDHELILSNAYGQVVKIHNPSRDPGHYTINVSSFPRGFYFLQLSTPNGGRSTQKIILQ